MNRLSKLLIVGLILAASIIAGAQPTLILSNDEVEVGEEVTITLKVEDFTNMSKMAISLNWNPTKLAFKEVASVNAQDIPELDFNNFVEREVEQGKLAFAWASTILTDISPEDGTEFFSLTFTSLGAGLDTVHLSNDPMVVELVRYISPTTSPTFLIEDFFISGGEIIINPSTAPLMQPALADSISFTISESNPKDFYCRGEEVCFDVRATGFTNILSQEYRITWDTDLLLYNETRNIAEELIGFEAASFVDANQVFTVGGWITPNIAGDGTSLPDNDLQYQLCFNVLGNDLAQATIQFSEEVKPYEILNVAETELAFIPNNAFAPIANCDQLVVLSTSCNAGKPGDIVCVNVTANNFKEVGNIFYSHNWDPAIMEFVELQNVNPDLVGLEAIDPVDGSVNISWTEQSPGGVTLTDNGTLYEACFRIKTTTIEGQTTSLKFDEGNLYVGTLEASFEDIRVSDDCIIEVEALPLPTVKLIASMSAVEEETTTCIDISLDNSSGVTSMEFPIVWDPQVLSFTEINNVANPSIVFDDRDAAVGTMRVSWMPSTTIATQGPLFSLCFEAIGEANSNTGSSAIAFPSTESDPVLFTINTTVLESEQVSGLVTLTPKEVVIEPVDSVVTVDPVEPVDSVVTVEPVEPVDSVVTVDPPANTSITVTNELLDNVKRNTSFCVPITVNDFSNIIVLQHAIKWDSTILQFDNLVAKDLPGLKSYNPSTETNNGNWNFFDKGQLNLSWLAGDDALGETLADNSVLAELCFTTIGDLGECTSLQFVAPDPLLVEVIDVNINELDLINEGQDICVTPFGIVNVEIQAPTCENNDGAIRIEMKGGSGYFATWIVNGNGIPVNATANNPFIPLENVRASFGEDEICVNILDSTNPGKLNADTCFVIEVNDTRIPIALAGDDIDIGCVNPDSISVVLEGDFIESGQASGGAVNFNWDVLGSGAIDPFSRVGSKATATAVGTYVLTFENANGCTDTDTMIVKQSNLPEISVESPELISCKNESILLRGQGNETGEDFLYEWTTESGEVLEEEDTLALAIRVAEGGRYIFSVKNTKNGCQAEEAILVQVDTDLPLAEAGPNKIKGCEDRFITLDGTSSDIGATIEYDWFTPDGSGIINFASQTPDVTRVGTYILTVKDRINGCASVDTMKVVADPSLPVARANDKAFIGCGDAPAELDGSPSSRGAIFSYTWEPVGGTPVANEIKTTVRDTGEYLLIVINVENDNCIADTARVQVTENQTMPTAEIPTNLTIGCAADCIETGVTTLEENPDLTYEWITEEGIICEGATTLNAQIGAIGLYKLILTNTANNCIDTSNILVFPDEDNSIIADAGIMKELNCVADTVELNGTGSSRGDNVIYEWRFGETESIISSEMTATVSQIGDYRLTVKDTESGCEGTSSVAVTEDRTMPVADAGTDFEISGCDIPAGLRLNGSNSDIGGEFAYLWTTANGRLMGDTSILSPMIGAPGIYTLTVTNKKTGCVSMDEMLVSSEIFTPVAFAGADQTITCTNNTITIDANESIVNENVIVEWTTEDGHILLGGNSLTPAVDSAGIYTLTITTEQGCKDVDEIQIFRDATVITADAGPDIEVMCYERMTVDGRNSSIGENLVVNWTTTDGDIVSGSNTLTPDVLSKGTYLLTIIDTTNNCQASDEVFVEEEEELPLADAGERQYVCGLDAVLTATPVRDSIIGKWTALEEGQLGNINNAETTVGNLAEEKNSFVWTLSSDNCPDYHADTVEVNRIVLPNASEDVFELTTEQGMVVLDLTLNDRINTTLFDVNLLTQPSTGDLTKVSEGVYQYTPAARFLGNQEFQYELCSQTCSDICDDALVKLSVRPARLDSVSVNPNAITPNNDGLNDALSFDVLYFDEFPQSELVIFNRWGDVVYKVSPYTNNWEGKSSTGDDLPEGTYYYILRMDISEGEIIRGDVSILR